MQFEIFTDSSASLDEETIKKYGIRVLEVPITVDGKDMTGAKLKDLYELMRKKLDVKTSLVNTDGFVRGFEKALKEGKDILYTGICAALSGTFSCAVSAAEILREKYPERRIVLVDSKSISLGTGLLVTEASEMKLSGKSIEEVEEYIKGAREEVNHLVCVSDLFYVKRSGRISGLEAVFGTLAGVRPLMNVDEDGYVKVYGKTVGKKRAFSRMIEKVVSNIKEGSVIGIAHCDCLPDAEFVKEKIKKFLPNKIKIAYVDPVIGTHAGPDALAIIFFGKNRAI